MQPEARKYTAAHEWVLPIGPTSVRFGITGFAAEALGDVVFVELPQVGQSVTAGDPCGEVESTKSVADVYAPVSGVITAVNDGLRDTPELVNTGPFDAGWMAEVDLGPGTSIEAALAALLDEAGYDALLRGLPGGSSPTGG